MEVEFQYEGYFWKLIASSPSFLSIRERTFWWVWGEYTWPLLFIFFSLYPTKHISKKFSFLFSLQSFSSTLFHLQTNKFLSSSFKFNHMTVLTRLMQYKYLLLVISSIGCFVPFLQCLLAPFYFLLLQSSMFS